MKSLLIATSNLGKLKEFKGLLGAQFVCESLPPETPVVVEDGKTYRENALKKAKGYFEMVKKPILSDDSGLEIDILKGAPGVDSAVYGGEGLTWSERWNFLYGELNKAKAINPTARFRCVLCYYDGVNSGQFFEATTEGHISPHPEGNQGFGYDPVFYSSELGKTLGEATAEEKAKVSHRARAVHKFLSWAHNNDS